VEIQTFVFQMRTPLFYCKLFLQIFLDNFSENVDLSNLKLKRLVFKIYVLKTLC